MRAISLVFIATISLPQLASASYDPAKIKNTLNDQAELFTISGWQDAPEPSSWTATVTQKWMSISVGPQKTELVTPYLNPTQIKASKTRCAAFAASGLSLHSDNSKNTISEMIEKSTQHHRLEYLEVDGARFEVIPKVVGAFVRLFCTIRPTTK